MASIKSKLNNHNQVRICDSQNSFRITEKDRLLLCYYPIECKELLQTYRRKIKNHPLLEAAREISQDFSADIDLNPLVVASGEVNLPADFWDEFHTSVGGTGDIHKNHQLLEQIT